MHETLTHLVVILLVVTSACTRRVEEEDSRDESKRRPSLDQLKESAPDWSKAFAQASRWDADRNAVVIDVTVAAGFHAYTEGETIGKPLLFELAPDSALKLGGAVTYPKGIVKDLPVGRSVIVEGKAEVVAPIAAPEAGKTAKGTFRYQVCTAEACDRPRTAEVSVQVP